MNKYLYRTAMLLFVFISLSATVSGQILMNYQGNLVDNSGALITDGIYDIAFSLHDQATGGTQVWDELHNGVQVSGGSFNLQLGIDGLLSPDILDDGDLFLQIQVIGDIPMMPRQQLTSVPFSGVASRLNGDIRTSIGMMELFDATYHLPVISMEDDGINDIRSIKVFDPQPEPPGIAMLFESNGEEDTRSIKLFDPQPEPPGYNALVDINANAFGGEIELGAPQIGGGATDVFNPKLRMQTNSNGGRISLDDEASQYMGVEPSPFLPGGYMFMVNPNEADTTFRVNSQGILKVDNNASGLESRLSPGNLLIQSREGGPLPPPPIYLNADAATARIGIGTDTPSSSLHVMGSVTIADGTQGAGKILTSDAFGFASWQTPTAVSSEQLNELRELIDRQNARIAELESKIDALEHRSGR